MGPARTGFDPTESKIGIANVAGLAQRWFAGTLPGDSIMSSPAVANGVAYVGSYDGKLYAYDAAGSTNCSGNPKICTPLWSVSRDGLYPIVANGIVYLGSTDGNQYAYGLP